MTGIILLIKLIIAVTLLNVWLFRFNKKTKFRGGDANSMKEEFIVYGLPLWVMYFVGLLKIMIAFILIIGIWINYLNIYAYYTLIALMVGALIMHVKVKDPLVKSIPALCILTLITTLVLFSL